MVAAVVIETDVCECCLCLTARCQCWVPQWDLWRKGEDEHTEGVTLIKRSEMYNVVCWE